ncbi:sigma-70 family RNA polymerase sigma factor [Novosphingobium terrae]|uniref:sigma-70 family RNA polymerase sigma factor n=1 Tax=Novosphingobium terrae TaxID=2726189 RepID=UPI00197EEE39|nr:sigma-70 family RNA polymerase sigma factor [Novosphingobium terrae]
MTSERLDLYLSHRKALIDQASRIIGDGARAEDVVQDAWLRFSSLSDTDSDGQRILQPLAYLRRIVRNLAIDLSRRQAHENWDPNGDADLAEMAAPEPTPEQTALARNELDHVTAALEGLPLRTRQAFDLYRFQGKTLSEVAVILGISQTRAHQLVQDAIARCTARLMQGGRP